MLKYSINYGFMKTLRIFVIFGISCLLTFLLTGYFFHVIKNIQTQAASYDESYVELSFAEPEQLPKTMEAGKNYSVPVILTSHKAKAQTFSLNVQVFGDSQPQLIYQTTIVGVPNIPIPIIVPVSIQNSCARCKVEFALVDESTGIDFWTQKI